MDPDCLIAPSEKSLAPDVLPYSTENCFVYLDILDVFLVITVFQKMVLYVAMDEYIC